MSFTQTDLDRIKKAIATGTLSVEVDGRRVQYRSVDELERAKQMIEQELANTSSVPAVRQVRFYSTKDL